MSDIGEMFKDLKAVDQQERSTLRANAPKRLQEVGIEFTSHNGGAHLIVKGHSCDFDFWPGTEKWRARGQKSQMNYGIDSLIKACGNKS